MGLAYVSSKHKNIMDCENHGLIKDNCPMILLEDIGDLQVIHGSNMANTFNKQKNKDREHTLQILSSEEMKKLLVSEEYPDMNIENIPLFTPNNQD